MFPSKTISADVIVVPGARCYIKGNYNPCLVGRINEAVKRYNQKAATKIIMSGGNDTEDGVNESRIMAQIAQDQGVPQNDIILEPHSTSTYENLAYSYELMKNNNFNSALIVAEPFHIPRIRLVARKLEIKHIISSADTPCWTRWGIFSKAFLREPFALVKYYFDGKI